MARSMGIAFFCSQAAEKAGSPGDARAAATSQSYQFSKGIGAQMPKLIPRDHSQRSQ